MYQFKKLLLSFLLITIAVIFVFLYGYYKYSKSTQRKKTTGLNIDNKKFERLSENSTLRNLEKLDIQMQKDKSLNVGILKEDSSLPKKMEEKTENVENIDFVFQNLVESIKRTNFASLSSNQNASVAMYNVIKYIALHELEVLMNTGTSYKNQLEIIKQFTTSDQDIFILVSKIEKDYVLGDRELLDKYNKILNKIDLDLEKYENKEDKSSIINKILSKTRKYFGFRKNDHRLIGKEVNDLLIKKNYNEAMVLLSKYNFLDQEILNFRDNLSHKVSINNSLFSAKIGAIHKLSQLTSGI